MAWGSPQTISDTSSFGQTWTNVVASLALNPRELAQFQIKADNQHASTVTDAMEIRVLSSADGGTTWDNTPVFAMSFKPSAVTPEYVSFNISGYAHIRVQAQSAGADTYIAGGFYRLDGVSA